MKIVVGPRDKFSEKIAEELNYGFVELKRDIFADGEVRPKISKPGKIRNESIILVNRMATPTDPNRNLVEYLFTLKNLKLLKADGITAIMPYFIYSRQDKIFKEGGPFSHQYVLELLKDAGADRLFTVSAHSPRYEGRFADGVLTPYGYNVSGFKPIANYLKNQELKDPVVIAPDLTAYASVDEVVAITGMEKLESINKSRDHDSGEINMESKLPDLNRRDLIIVDDIASSGGTLFKAIELGKEANADNILCAVVHPVLAGYCLGKMEVESERPNGAQFVATNTIYSSISKISVIPELAKHL